jgi:predicted RNA methylase
VAAGAGRGGAGGGFRADGGTAAEEGKRGVTTNNRPGPFDLAAPPKRVRKAPSVAALYRRAAARLEEAVAAGDRSEELRRALNRIYRQLVPRWHFAMLNDARRNAAFESALHRLDLRGKVVLDIGTGSGLLAMMAARAGAEAVVACEAIESIAAVARQIITRNGFADRVEIIPALSLELDASIHLPRRADVLVTETVDCGLVGEGIMPTLRHARRELLAPQAEIIPASARVVGRLIESGAVHQLNFAQQVLGFDVSPFNRFSTSGYFPCRLGTWPHRFLSEPFDLFAFDFRRDPLTPQQRTVAVEVGGRGVLHGLACWWELDLGSGVSLTNAPGSGDSHWMQAVALFDSPRVVTRGERLVLRAEQDDEAMYFWLGGPAG